MATALLNTWTSGEISDDAWDRADIQPVNKGCEAAINYVLRIAGPLGKRRGFWRIGSAADPTKAARLVPFRRSIDDALMLEFGDAQVRVWQASGAPLMNGGVQVSFASPYSAAQLANLRFKQVADVIYFRDATGQSPQALTRTSDTSWAFAAESFPNGPWLPENTDTGRTITVAATDLHDATAGTGAGVILAGEAITLTASTAIFNAQMVGGTFRLRQNSGAPGVKTWSTGFRPPVAGCFCGSAGRVYTCTTLGIGPLTSGVDQAVTTPPVVVSGTQSDGGNIWEYLHDGAGVVRIDAYTDATHVSGTVIRAVPMKSGDVTSCWAEGAYSAYRGWPRMWPAMVEERLIDAATTSNLDMLDMTETAGFDPSSQTYTPGLGNGAVVDTDAIRRRVGTDGAEVLWSREGAFLMIGTASGEFVASGGLFGNPITPSSIVVRRLSGYGSADVYPALVHDGIAYVTRGGQAVRSLALDMQQAIAADDLSFQAAHISARLFKQLAWVPYPDEVLWARLGDGGLAAFTDHREQQVRGWTRQALPGGFVVEDIVTLPGPGRLETLWLIVSRTKGGAVQRALWMQSQASDALFIDGAELYAGAPAASIGGLLHYAGETCRVLADGAQYDLPVAADGTVALPVPASTVQAGLGYQTVFRSLKLDLQGLMAALNLRQRPTQLVLRLKTSTALVGALDGLTGQAGPTETVSSRTAQNVPGAAAQPFVGQTTIALGSTRDPRIVVTEDSAYDHILYSLKPSIAVGG